MRQGTVKNVKCDNLLKTIFLDAMPTLLGSILNAPVEDAT